MVVSLAAAPFVLFVIISTKTQLLLHYRVLYALYQSEMLTNDADSRPRDRLEMELWVR